MHENVTHVQEEEREYRVAKVNSEKRSRQFTQSKVDPKTGKAIVEIKDRKHEADLKTTKRGVFSLQLFSNEKDKKDGKDKKD